MTTAIMEDITATTISFDFRHRYHKAFYKTVTEAFHS